MAKFEIYVADFDKWNLEETIEASNANAALEKVTHQDDKWRYAKKVKEKEDNENEE